ncbi:MAG TPA: YdcF family protein [Actinomycetota bacterium]|nr:YdcF family protein [Actinomycetota bacterium]
MRFARRFLLVIVLACIAYPLGLGFQIWQQSHRDELAGADAIVVLGAAQYDGKPSPVFRARLDHAAYLYNEGFSGRVIVTGGKQRGDRFTEAEAGRQYLIEAAVEPEDILEEPEGRTTLQSLENVKSLAELNRIASLLLVSDPLHSERIKRIAEDLGFQEVYTSPASYLELQRSRLTKAKELLREVASLMAYELFGR